jgi:hypothetical protein
MFCFKLYLHQTAFEMHELPSKAFATVPWGEYQLISVFLDSDVAKL